MGLQIPTNSSHEHLVYPNLLESLTLCRPFQAIAADITYIRLKLGFCYLSLVTDLFSRVVVGWYLSDSLDASGALQALRAARLTIGPAKGHIHHSDQGVQYCCTDYVKLLFRFGMKISMTDTGSPGQNAVAERVNGILKSEFLLNATFSDLNAALLAVRQAITVYNHERPHCSLGLQTPAEFLRANNRK